MRKNLKPKASSLQSRRCAIYTRKSTTHGLDQEFSSLDAQWDACAGYVRGQPSWELVEGRYDDGGFTGANLERPAFQRLLADVEEGRIDVVVVYKIDRLSRSLLDFASLMERFRKAGAYFVSVTQPFLSADSDAMAQLLLNVLMAFAQFERQMIAERIRDKVVASRRKGLWTGGNVPYGYHVQDRKLRPRQEEAVVVRRMVELFLATQSDSDVTRELAAHGVLTRKERPWTPQSVARVLTNPVYAGFVTLGSELHDGEHEPLIDRETFEQLQSLRATSSSERQSKNAQRQRNLEYVLRGNVYCGCQGAEGQPCSFAMTPASTRKGRKSYRYYRCIARDKVSPKACPARPLAAPELEELVRSRVADVARQLDEQGQGTGVTVDGGVVRHAGRRIEELKTRRAGLRERLTTVEAELRAIAQATAEGGDRGAYHQRQHDKRSQERDRVQKELREVREALGNLERLVLNGPWLAEQLRGFDAVWDKLLPANRLRVMRLIVERVDANSVTGEVNITLAPWVGAMLGGRMQGEEATDAA